MAHALEFISLKFGDFKNFHGDHRIQLKQQPGLYFWTGKNKLHPQMGANGVGKSSIFDALFWCFWGKTVKDSRPANAVVPWDEAKAAPAVMVYFKRDGNPYTIIRTRKPNRLLLRTVPIKNGDYAESSDKEITQEDVPGILGMNEETFRRTILIGQFGTMFLDLKPEAQSTMFSEALELDRWLAASKKAAAQANMAEAALQRGKDEMNRLTGKLEAMREQRDTAKDMAATWDETHEGTLVKLAATQRARAAALKKLTDSPVGKPAKAQALRDALVQAQKANASADTAARAVERKIAQLEAWLENNTRNVAQASKNITKLEDAGKDKVCPTCGQTVTGKHLRDELKAARDVLVQLEKTRAEETDNLHTAKEVSDTCNKTARKAKRAVDEAEETIREAERAYTEWEADVRVAEREAKTADQELKAGNKLENPYTSTVEEARERITQLKEDIKEAGLGISQDELKHGQFKYWVNAFKEIRLSLIDEVLQELEIASAEHAARLGLVDWDIKFQTERENKAGDISYGFNVLLYPPGQKEPVRWESYSGGEDRRWQLAVTFGLSEVLLARAGLTSNFEVLDEPAQHMSAEGVEALLECLSDRAKEQDKTIFYVDHTSLDRGYFDGVFTVQRDKEGSNVLS